MKLRILHVLMTVDSAYGGPVEGVRHLAKQNQAIGHTVEVASLDCPGAADVDQMGVKVHPLGSRLSRRFNYGYSPHFVPWLRKHRNDYDCVVINGIWSYNCYGTWLALHDTSVPYFVFPHGMLDPWSKRMYPAKHMKKWLYWPWGAFPALRGARAVFFTCDEERRLARSTFWLYDCNELVVRYGVTGCPEGLENARDAFLDAHPELRGKRLALFLGRIHRKKGADILLRSIRTLLAEGSWDPRMMRLVLAGPLEDGPFVNGLRRFIRENGMSDIVCWTGMLAGAQKWGALQAAEVFVLPSHQENFGIAVVEALSVGSPVLISNAVNIWREIVEHGAGIVGDPTDRGCAAMLREWLRRAPVEGAAMRRRAIGCFNECFTAKQSADTFLSSVFMMLASPERAAHN